MAKPRKPYNCENCGKKIGEKDWWITHYDKAARRTKKVCKPCHLLLSEK